MDLGREEGVDLHDAEVEGVGGHELFERRFIGEFYGGDGGERRLLRLEAFAGHEVH